MFRDIMWVPSLDHLWMVMSSWKIIRKIYLTNSVQLGNLLGTYIRQIVSNLATRPAFWRDPTYLTIPKSPPYWRALGLAFALLLAPPLAFAFADLALRLGAGLAGFGMIGLAGRLWMGCGWAGRRGKHRKRWVETTPHATFQVQSFHGPRTKHGGH